MRKLIVLLVLVFPVLAYGQAGVTYTNAGTTGTTLNSLAIINTSNNAVIAGTGNTNVPAFIVVGGAGTSGLAVLAVAGQANCTMDSTIASAAGGDYVIASTTTGGDCHAQSASPTTGTWVIGTLASSSTTSGSVAAVTVVGYFFGCPTCVGSSASLTNNAVVLGAGGQLSQTSDLQFSSHITNDTTNTQSLTYAGGTDASANSALGGVTVRGANQTGAGGASSAGGGALVSGGSNAASNTSSVAGSAEISAGQSTNATTGQQGLMISTVSYAKGTTSTQWNLQCAQSTAMQTQDCGATPTTIIGVAESVGTNSVTVVYDGQTPINASAAVTLGHTVCAGSTAGQITDSGGTAACTSGATVGTVEATSGTWTYPDGTSFTASTTLPLIHVAGFQSFASSGITSALLGFNQLSAQTPTSVAPYYFSPSGSINSLVTTEASEQQAMAVGGTVKGISCRVSAAEGAAATLAFTLMKCTPSSGACSGSAQTVTCTIGNSSLTCSDTAHSFTFLANDFLDIKMVQTGTGTSQFIVCTTQYTIP